MHYCADCNRIVMGDEHDCIERRGMMTLYERQAIVTAFVESVVLPTMLSKGAEYATDDGDPNGNFKRVAEETGMPVLQVWNSHFSKHLDAIRNYVKSDGKAMMVESIDGRIADAINYLLILKTLIEERKTV